MDDWEEVDSGSGKYWWNKRTNETTEVGAKKPIAGSVALNPINKEEKGAFSQGLAKGGALLNRMTDSIRNPLTLSSEVQANKTDLRSETCIREKKKVNTHSHYYDADGECSPKDIVEIGKFDEALPDPGKKLLVVKEIEDENSARIARIKDFENKSADCAIDLSSNLRIEPLLGDGDKLISYLDVQEIENYPSDMGTNKGESLLIYICNFHVLKVIYY